MLTAALVLTAASLAPATPQAAADPPPVAPDAGAAPVDPAAAVVAPVDHAAGVVPPGGEAAMRTAPPATTTAPDGWTLTVGAKDEVLRNVQPLTTALFVRDYEVSGVFTGADARGRRRRATAWRARGGLPDRLWRRHEHIAGRDPDQSCRPHTLDQTRRHRRRVTVGGDVNPILLAPVTGGVAVGLKPGIINMVPVAKKEFKGTDPWVSVERLPREDG